MRIHTLSRTLEFKLLLESALYFILLLFKSKIFIAEFELKIFVVARDLATVR